MLAVINPTSHHHRRTPCIILDLEFHFPMSAVHGRSQAYNFPAALATQMHMYHFCNICATASLPFRLGIFPSKSRVEQSIDDEMQKTRTENKVPNKSQA